MYKSGYYRTVYELQKGTGIGFDIAGLDTKRLDAVAHKPWSLDSRTFSDRIWGQKDKMVGALHQEIIRNCIYGRSQKDAAKALEQYVKKDIKNAEYCARRVIVTETAYFSALSQRDGLLELDCEWYEIDLPIDARSCALCRDMNGRRFKMSEFEVGATAPPFHPYCANGAIIPYFDDDFDVDTDREGAREISEDISYGGWEREFVKNDLTGGRNGGIIKADGDYTINLAQGQGKEMDEKADEIISAQSVLNKQKTLNIIKRGIAEKEPIFDDGLLGTRYTRSLF